MSSTRSGVDFSQVEAEVLLQMAQKFDGGSLVISNEEILREHDELDEASLRQIMQRFTAYNLVSRDGRNTVKISPQVLSVVDQLQNPPQRDYWKELQQWLFASKWRVGVMAFAIVLPLIVQWVEMLKTVVSWLTVGE